MLQAGMWKNCQDARHPRFRSLHDPSANRARTAIRSARATAPNTLLISKSVWQKPVLSPGHDVSGSVVGMTGPPARTWEYRGILLKPKDGVRFVCNWEGGWGRRFVRGWIPSSSQSGRENWHIYIPPYWDTTRKSGGHTKRRDALRNARALSGGNSSD